MKRREGQWERRGEKVGETESSTHICERTGSDSEDKLAPALGNPTAPAAPKPSRVGVRGELLG